VRSVIYDVSRAAREQAKVAMFGAVARGLDQEEAEKRRTNSSNATRFPRSTERSRNSIREESGRRTEESER
jgi:hypothetical protein